MGIEMVKRSETHVRDGSTTRAAGSDQFGHERLPPQLRRPAPRVRFLNRKPPRCDSGGGGRATDLRRSTP